MKETKNVFMSELTEVFSKRQQQFVKQTETGAFTTMPIHRM